MRDSDRKLLGGMAGLVGTFAAVNGLGYYIAGGQAGYNSAQGGASLFFMVSLLVSPVGMILGARSGEVLTAIRKRRKRSKGD